MSNKWILMLVCISFLCSPFLACNDNYYYDKAYNLSCEQKYVEAIDLLESNIEVNNRKFDYYHTVGFYTLLADTIKNRREALADFLHANEIIGDDQQNLFMIGYCYKLLNEEENAIVYLLKSAELYNQEKDEINPFPEMAEVFYNTKQYSRAMDIIDLALSSEPENSYLLLLKSFIYDNLGDFNKGELFYKYSLEKNLDDLYLLYRAHHFIEIERYTEAITILKQAIEKSVRENVCLAELGYIELITGDREKAGKMLNDAGKMGLSDELVLRYLTYYYYYCRDKERTEFFLGLYMLMADDLETITITDVFSEVEKRFANDITFEKLVKLKQE